MGHHKLLEFFYQHPVQHTQYQNIIGFTWCSANKLRGPDADLNGMALMDLESSHSALIR